MEIERRVRTAERFGADRWSQRSSRRSLPGALKEVAGGLVGEVTRTMVICGSLIVPERH